MKFLFNFLLLLLFSPVICCCQSGTIERAKQKIYQSKTDAETLSNLIAIGKLRNALQGDTIYHYAQWAKKLAIQLKDEKAQAWAEYSLISSVLVKGKAESVIEKIDSNTIFKNIKKADAALYYKIQLLKANALNRLDKRTEALDLQLKILSDAEKENNTNVQLFALNLIGATYLNVNRPADAKHAWLQGLQIINEKNNPENQEIEAYILSNLALYYFNAYSVQPGKQMADSFFNTINKTIALSTENENLSVLASAFSLRGNFYGLMKDITAGEKDFTAGLAIRKKIGDPLYIAEDFTGLSNFYFNVKQYKKCIETAEEGIAIADSNGIKGPQLTLFKIIGMAYKAQGNYEQYSNALEKLIAIAGTTLQINSAEKIAEIQTKYDVQKKETLIAQQKLDLFRRNLLLYGSGILAALLTIFFIYRFKKYQQRQKLIMEEKRKQNEMAVKDAEDNERKRIAAELHDNLGVQANAILHNSSLLALENNSNKHVVTNLQETAKEMLHNLRETLWAMKNNDINATDLWLRIINFMKQMGRHYTSINFNVEGESPVDFLIPSNKALNMVLVMQEAVNNAVKHAQANNITAISLTEAGAWTISIQDDGQGFDTAESKETKDNYGLQNMKERATASAIALSVISKPGKGTRITLTL